jgi:hypothetical protein
MVKIPFLYETKMLFLFTLKYTICRAKVRREGNKRVLEGEEKDIMKN